MVPLTGTEAAPGTRRRRTARALAAVAVAGCLAALTSGCPAPSRTAEDTTDIDVRRADALRADPVLSAGPFADGAADPWVAVGENMDNTSAGGWKRTYAETEVTLPPVPAADREQANHDTARRMLADLRATGWTVFHTACETSTSGLRGGTWTISAHRRTSDYTLSLRAVFRLGNEDSGAGQLTVVAPYHLDPADLLGTPPPAALPAGTSCLDQPVPPTVPQVDGTDVGVATFVAHQP